MENNVLCRFENGDWTLYTVNQGYNKGDWLRFVSEKGYVTEISDLEPLLAWKLAYPLKIHEIELSF